MCGIAGSYSKNKLNSALLEETTDSILHRGPDACGYYTSENNELFLGHRRLSILDLSAVANQPMTSSCGRFILVYNGEIYNFHELKNKLPDFPWRSHSDTEVLLELFAKHGPECFKWLNGMFALAIYDQREHKLFLCRDQAGIKPLFYYREGTELIFGSELKFVTSYARRSGIQLHVDQGAIPYFLHLGFIPEPGTIYRHVHKFPSGSYAIFDPRTQDLTFTRYWQAEHHFLPHPVKDEKQALEQYRQTLLQAVEDQMISDVPLGTFLSGGIDSSLVTAVASKMSAHIKSFSIGFHEAKYDESGHAAAVARHLGTDHHCFKVSVDDILELVPSLLQVYDEPFGDSSAFPTMLVSRLARQHVTVALSGDGGDELFQGYGMYTWANRLNDPFIKAFRKPLYAVSQLMDNRIKRGGRLFNYPSASRLHSHIFSQEQYFFSEQELDRMLIRQAFDFTNLNDLHVDKTLGTPAERQALWDIQHYLKDDLLVKVDRASMRYSLETRVPLLDTRLIELGMNIDYSLKVRGQYGSKYLMKKVLYEMVPQEIFARPKRGFAIPLKEWLYGPLKHLTQDYLNEDIVRTYGIVDAGLVKELLRKFYAGEDYLYNRIWLLIVLHWWLKDNDATLNKSALVT